MTNDDSIEHMKQRIAALEAEAAELDERNLQLEREIARRGVKLSCANIALARAKIAFDEVSRHREEAIQDIAHDLRTPLTSIKGAVANVLDGIAGPIDPAVRDYLEIVGEQSERLIGVVNWLVQAIRITSEPLDRNDELVDVADLVRRVTGGLRPIADEKRLALTVNVEAPIALWVDERKIYQVLENLIGNALKFTSQGGVTITVEESRDQIRISVEDSGTGMTPEALEKIFHRYYRAHSDAPGSGLGLLIAREMARLHGGDITVRSECGVGSTFTLVLPRDTEPAPPINALRRGDPQAQ